MQVAYRMKFLEILELVGIISKLGIKLINMEDISFQVDFSLVSL